jgi:putative ABC transport system substrate-binding protein
MIHNRLIIITLFGILFCQATTASANEIVVVRTANIKPYAEVLEGFRDACKCNVTELAITETNISELYARIRKIRPDLIVTIGLNAFSAIKNINNIPIVFTMVSNPKPLLSGRKNITGISMNISAEQQLSKFLELSPETKRIGMVYDSEKTIDLFKEAQEAASALGITIVSQDVHDSRDVFSAIANMKGKIDAFWMLPDTTMISYRSLDYIMLFSFENKIPILTFSHTYVEMGALISLNIDTIDIGQQAGRMANNILSGTDIDNIPISPPRKAALSLNLKTANRMGIKNAKIFLEIITKRTQRENNEIN